MKFRMVFCLALLFALNACVTTSGGLNSPLFGRPSAEQFAQLETTTPRVIEETYKDNPLDADRTYKDKWAKVKGEIAVSVSANNRSGKTTGYSLILADVGRSKNKKGSTLHCTFGLDKETELRSLKKGQVVVIGGKFTQYDNVLGSASLTDCIIIQK